MQGPFDGLNRVFSVAGKTLLSAEEERALAERLWQSRRRLRVFMVLGTLGRAPGGAPSLEVKPHTAPLSPGLRKRLLASEKEARALLERFNRSGERNDPLRRRISRELAILEETRETLLSRNLRLVAWIAKGFQTKGLDLLDLFQEGAMALLWSIDRFDPARGTRLSTFASYAIRLGIIRALADKGRVVRIPNHRFQEVLETISARARLMQRLEREPRLEEIQQEVDIPREKLEDLIGAVRPMISIDAPFGGAEAPLSDVLLDEASLSPFELAARAEASALTRRALRRLSDRERTIVSMRYGLGGSDERSYEEIGRSLGISRERTRQLETAARGKLRTAIESGLH
jgi:RNA polymerase sigma factor (sigma-70 family)